MRYDSLHNSKKQLYDRQRTETPPVFTPLKQCFAYCFAHWRSPGVCRQPFSFWSITLKCLDADQSTIPNMKGDILSFHMMHRSMICSKRLQRNSIRIPIEESYLVCSYFLVPWSKLWVSFALWFTWTSTSARSSPFGRARFHAQNPAVWEKER